VLRRCSCFVFEIGTALYTVRLNDDDDEEAMRDFQRQILV